MLLFDLTKMSDNFRTEGLSLGFPYCPCIAQSQWKHGTRVVYTFSIFNRTPVRHLWKNRIPSSTIVKCRKERRTCVTIFEINDDAFRKARWRCIICVDDVNTFPYRPAFCQIFFIRRRRAPLQ